MSFKYSCYIENSQEAREWLTSIGIRLNTYLRFELAKYIYFYNDTGIACFINDRDLSMMNTETTDCTGNLPLFKALTAVRDDSDYMQYFVADCFLDFSIGDEDECYSSGELFLCREKNSEDLKFDWLRLPTYVPVPFFHKATKEELLEHFPDIKEVISNTV